MQYFTLLKQGLLWSWRQKKLWLFGLFVSILGNGGVIELMIRSFSIWNVDDTPRISFFTPFLVLVSGNKNMHGISGILKLPFKEMIIPTVVILICILIIILLFWCVVVSFGAVVTSAAGSGRISGTKFSQSIQNGLEHQKSVAMFIVSALAIISMLFWVVGRIIKPLIIVKTGLLVGIISVLISVALFIFALVLFFIALYGSLEVVLRGVSFREAFYSATAFIRRTLLQSLEMAFILFVVSSIIAATSVIVSIIFGWPFLLASILLYWMQSAAGMWTVFIIGVVIMIGLITVAGMVVALFQLYMWTQFYLSATSTKKIPTGLVSRIRQLIRNKLMSLSTTKL